MFIFGIFVYLNFVMSLSLLTLNTGGCSTQTQNVSFKVYVEQIAFNPDVIFLQETYQLKDSSACWNTWSHKPFCSPGISRGSGVTTLVNDSKIVVSSTYIVFDGYILYNKLCHNDRIYHVYNTLIPQSDEMAIQAIAALNDHTSTCCDGTIVIAGDFNCTENPAIDRLCTLIERRPKVVTALKGILNKLFLCDAWRRLNPNEKKFTWQRYNPASAQGFSKSRLDRFYLPLCLVSFIHSCKIIPCSLSDHSAVLLILKFPTSVKGKSAYWHFNNSLLEDENYKELVRLFWSDWQKEKSDFPNVASWWDFGKVHIKSITKMYSVNLAHEKRKSLVEINEEIDNLMNVPEFSPQNKRALDEQKNALNSLLRNEARGALVRSRFKYTNETDSCSSFFFNLEKTNSLSKCISRIRLPSGCISEDPIEIKRHVREFYESLYSRHATDESALNDLFVNIKTLDASLAEDLESSITVEELDNAVKQLGKNKSPGLDGLTSEFYQVFWPILRKDFQEILTSSLESGILPYSFRRAVITLLPKKGDLADISNWRPVSLLNTDYKIFAKLLASRLKHCIGHVIGRDQSYCIPGRSIYDNINLIRDAIFYANVEDIPLAVLNLDQKKAFDNVDHGYLFNVMKLMGFGNQFISYIQTLYEGAESLIKVCGSLTTPFSFQKGIRQGCPLSGLLYTIAIEPLLNSLREKLSKYALNIPGTDKSCVVSAYADDVSIFITSDAGFAQVEQIYTIFSRASAACLNTKKSQGLWVGRWIGRNDLPLKFSWNSEGLPFLGVHLGNSVHYSKQNWVKCKDRLTKTFLSWSRLSKSLSFKGKVLIANQLAASKIFHFLAVLPVPGNVLNELQELLVNFVWSNKRHWLRKEVLYDQPDEGGLGLACLQARILSYRFAIVQRFLLPNFHPANDFMAHFLRQYCKLGFDYQLFYVKIDPKFFTSLSVFYSEVLRAWMASGARILTQSLSFGHVMNMPLNSTYVIDAIDNDAFFPVRLMACGVKLVRHLINPSSGLWIEPSCFRENFRGLRPPSLRLIEHETRLLRHALSQSFPTFFHNRGCDVPGSVDLQTLSLFPSTPLNFTLPSSENGLCASSKAVYKIYKKHLNNTTSSSSSHWHNIGYLDPSTKMNWSLIYKLPTSKKEGDIQYRLHHNILPPLTVLHHLNPDISSLCGWCGKLGTIQHLFIECQEIQPSLKLLYNLLDNLLPSVDLTFDMYWTLIPHARGRDREAIRLANFLIISYKSVIYSLYRTSMFSDPLIVWIHRLKNRILYEFSYYKLCSNIDGFLRKWCINDLFFVIHEGHITWLI